MSIAKQVFEWLENYPYLKWGLKNDFVNFSSVARKIQKELNIKNFDAILVAIRRYQENLRLIENTKIKEIIKECSLEIRTKINVYVTKNMDFDVLKNIGKFNLVSGKEWYVLITDKKLKLNTIKYEEEVVEVSIKSNKEIENCPGFAAFIYSSLAEAGINIIETYSMWTETILILNKKDLANTIYCLEKIGIK
jgi:aspartokinase